MNVDHLLRQTCTIFVAGDQNRFGKNAYDGGTDFACRFQQTNRIIQKANGEKAPVDGVVWMASADNVHINDKLVFSDAVYRVLKISPIVDGRGITRHYELMVNDWSTG